MKYGTMISIVLAAVILPKTATAGADATDPAVRWEFDTKA
jgi:hypothetical protein